MKHLAPTELFFMAVYTWKFYYDLSESSFGYNQIKRMDTLHEYLNTCFECISLCLLIHWWEQLGFSWEQTMAIPFIHFSDEIQYLNMHQVLYCINISYLYILIACMIAGIYFCVTDDLKTLGNIKMDKASYNMLNILRNTQRMREIRTPGITRFAVSSWRCKMSHFSDSAFIIFRAK